MSLFDLLKPKAAEVISSQELAGPYTPNRAQREEADNTHEAKKAARNSQGTDAKSTARVPTVGKETTRSLLNGGMTSYKSRINPTDFIPDPNQDNQSQTPDYYREGMMKVKTKTVDGRIVETVEWSPVPELIVERDRPVLASIRLVGNNKPASKGPNSGTPKNSQLIPEFSKFFLESVSEAENERFQIVETFNDFYVYFYGKKPAIYTFQGHLLNLLNYNWMNEFMYYYENFWRGTKAVELGAKVFLTYNFQQIQGYIVNVNTNITALTDKAVPFSFSMIVTKRLIFNGSPNDNLLRDNLLPRSDTGLINTSASSFAKALTSEFLNRKIPASDNKVASAKNEAQGNKLLDKANNSIKQYIPSAGSINPLTPKPGGEQRADFFKRALKLDDTLTERQRLT